MGPNYDALSGIANGIKEGMLAYQTANQIKRQQETEGLLKGYQTNPQTGQIEFTPQKQAEMEFNRQKMAHERGLMNTDIALQDPNSPESQRELANFKNIYGKDLAPGTTGKEAQGLLGSAGTAYKAENSYDIADLRNQTALARLAQMQNNPNAGIRTDALTQRAVSKITGDTVLNTIKTQGRQMDKALDLLNQEHVPNKTLAEVGQDIAGALSGKQAASDFKMKQVDVDNVKKEIADKLSFWTSNPDLEAPKEIVSFWKGMANRLNESIDKQVGNRANEFGSGLESTYKHTPQAIEAMRKMISDHQKGAWRRLGAEPQVDDQSQGLLPNQQQGPQQAPQQSKSKPTWAL